MLFIVFLIIIILSISYTVQNLYNKQSKEYFSSELVIPQIRYTDEKQFSPINMIINPLEKATLDNTSVTSNSSVSVIGAGNYASRMLIPAFEKTGMTADDIDLFEINEAFAAQVLPSAEEVGIDLDKLNVNGGAIALGHPFGMTGARIMTTLLNGLEDSDKEFGVESMCVGGGQGMAMVVQRLN